MTDVTAVMVSQCPSRFARSIQEQFEDFHRENPRVYNLLVGYCRAALQVNQRVGIRAVWERMRWHVYIETQKQPGDDFKLNDHYTSRYARLIMQQEPDLYDFFEIRELRTK